MTNTALGFNFVSDEYEDGFDGEMMPVHWANFRVKEAEVKPTKNGSGKMVSIQVQIIDGPFTNRIIFSNYNIENSNADAVKIGRGQLSTFAKALGVPNFSDTRELLGRFARGKVVAGKDSDDGRYEARNEVRNWKPFDPNVPSEVPAAPVNPAGFAAPAFAPQMPAMPPGYGQGYPAPAAYPAQAGYPAPAGYAPAPAQAPAGYAPAGFVAPAAAPAAMAPAGYAPAPAAMPAQAAPAAAPGFAQPQFAQQPQIAPNGYAQPVQDPSFAAAAAAAAIAAATPVIAAPVGVAPPAAIIHAAVPQMAAPPLSPAPAQQLAPPIIGQVDPSQWSANQAPAAAAQAPAAPVQTFSPPVDQAALQAAQVATPPWAQQAPQ